MITPQEARDLQHHKPPKYYTQLREAYSKIRESAELGNRSTDVVFFGFSEYEDVQAMLSTVRANLEELGFIVKSTLYVSQTSPAYAGVLDIRWEE